MKKLIFILPVMIIIGLAACKPAHDNPYDPDNPKKATLRGYVFGLNDQPVPDAEILLIQDTIAWDTAWSGADGFYEFTDIDPGIYRLAAYADHYIPFEPCECESLRADTVVERDIWFYAQYYCFEEEILGTVQPFGFDTVCGFWRVGEDLTAPERHTTPNVYHAEKTTAGFPAISLVKNSSPSFRLETKLKVLNMSDPSWLVGVVFRFRNQSNFYFAGITDMGVVLNRWINDSLQNLQIWPGSFQVNNWYDFSVAMCGHDIFINVGGSELTFPAPDTLLSVGKAGLLVDAPPPGGQVFVNFDDVLIGR